MENWGFELLYEDGPCLVINKPGGIATQAPPGIDSVEVRVRKMLAARHGEQDDVYLGVPHRLDRPASGALVMATSRRAARRLSEQFAAQVVQKTYWTLVEGQVSPPAGCWTDWIRKIPDRPEAQLTQAGSPDARQAILYYQVRRQWEHGCWLEIGLQTGRMHQIRVQAASRGHAVWGDTQYGAKLPFGPETEDPRERWIALHSRQLIFRHPISRSAVSVCAPLPSWWQSAGTDWS